MKVLAWFLVSFSNYYAGYTTWSPPMQTLEDCQRVQQAVKAKTSTACVQINTWIK